MAVGSSSGLPGSSGYHVKNLSARTQPKSAIFCRVAAPRTTGSERNDCGEPNAHAHRPGAAGPPKQLVSGIMTPTPAEYFNANFFHTYVPISRQQSIWQTTGGLSMILGGGAELWHLLSERSDAISSPSNCGPLKYSNMR